MTHGVVYSEPGIYAGWPANHGAWQWGDEFLVGFLRGKYKYRSMHNIAEPFDKVQARSLDGGSTWSIEIPDKDFSCSARLIPEDAPAFDLQGQIIRVCGVYDHGGEDCYEPGGFYISADRGHSWQGPFRFNGLEDYFSRQGAWSKEGTWCAEYVNTSRTQVHEGLLYLSRASKEYWGTDETICASHDGLNFQHRSTVWSGSGRAVMPAVARSGGRLIVALRRLHSQVDGGWIDAVCSCDEGKSWSHLSKIGDTGGHNGNPPALIALLDGTLCCVYGNRDHRSINCSVSSDGGETWRSSVVRDGGLRDIGYPQLFLRSDGRPVCVYYWADSVTPQQHIASSVLDI